MATNTAQFPQFVGFLLESTDGGVTFRMTIPHQTKTVDGIKYGSIAQEGLAAGDILGVCQDGYQAVSDAVVALGYTMPEVTDLVNTPIIDPQPGLPLSGA